MEGRPSGQKSTVPKGAVKSLPGKNPGWGKLTGGAQKLGPGK